MTGEIPHDVVLVRHRQSGTWLRELDNGEYIRIREVFGAAPDRCELIDAERAASICEGEEVEKRTVEEFEEKREDYERYNDWN